MANARRLIKKVMPIDLTMLVNEIEGARNIFGERLMRTSVLLGMGSAAVARLLYPFCWWGVGLAFLAPAGIEIYRLSKGSQAIAEGEKARALAGFLLSEPPVRIAGEPFPPLLRVRLPKLPKKIFVAHYVRCAGVAMVLGSAVSLGAYGGHRIGAMHAAHSAAAPSASIGNSTANNTANNTGNNAGSNSSALSLVP